MRYFKCKENKGKKMRNFQNHLPPAMSQMHETMSSQFMSELNELLDGPPETPQTQSSGSMRDALFRHTANAFIPTFTAHLKNYLQALLVEGNYGRDIFKLIIKHSARYAMNMLNALSHDAGRGIDRLNEAHIRSALDGFFNGTHGAANHIASMVRRRFEVGQNLPDIKIPFELTQMIDENPDMVPEELICPITREIMTNPVLLIGATSASTYDKESLLTWERTNGEITRDPLNGEELDLQQRQMTPNRSIREALVTFISESVRYPLPVNDNNDRFRGPVFIHPQLNRILSANNTDLPKKYVDPFTGNLMTQPVILDGLTCDLSSINPETLTLSRLDDGISIILPGEARTVVKFESWSDLVNGLRDDTLKRTQIATFVSKPASQRGLRQDQPGAQQNSDNLLSQGAASIFGMHNPNRQGGLSMLEQLQQSEPPLFEDMSRETSASEQGASVQGRTGL